jgi:hypothetical protein
MNSQRFVKCLSSRTRTHLNWGRLSTSDGPPSGGTSYGPQNGLTITHEKMENLGAQGTVLSIPMATAVRTDSVSSDKRQRNATTIGILSDNVLLEIFDQCRKSDDEYCRSPYNVWKWHLLVHVCQWWRQIIFSSPRRLDLHLHCTYGTPFREMLGIWPTAIPIIILFPNDIRPRDEENLIATLEHPDRVSRIELSINESQLEENAVFMQEPLPVLTHLSISPYFGYTSDLPDGFLGGSAPSLQQLDLSDVQYLALPTLLLSATNLVNLRLRDIPPTPYNSPMAMVSHVAALPKLEILDIDFTGLTSLRDIILSPLLTRSILPALCVMSLSGECKYLEDFVSRIDAPQLNSILVYYESGHINSDFDSPELSKFINRSESLKIFLSRHWSRHCKIMVDQDQDIVIFCVGNTTIKQWNHKPGISVCLGEGIEGQVSHMANILGHISPIPSDIVHCTIDHVVLYMHKSASLPEQEYQDGLDWLQLLRHLTSLQTLFVSAKIAGPISQALAYADTGMITEVLPSVKLLCLEESESESEDQHMRSVHNFLAVHQESGHPVTFVETKKEFEEIFKFYQ